MSDPNERVNIVRPDAPRPTDPPGNPLPSRVSTKGAKWVGVDVKKPEGNSVGIPAAPLASTDPPTEPLFCRKCGGHAGHYSDCPEVERALASTDPTPPDEPSPKFAVTSAEKARWRKFDGVALEVLCRVFDDGADKGFDEWRHWRDPGDWLSPQRALGAFIRRRLALERTKNADLRAELLRIRRDLLHVCAETAELRQDRDRVNVALESTGIGGIFDEFHDPADAITQMAQHIRRLESDEAMRAAYPLHVVDAARAVPPQEDATS